METIYNLFIFYCDDTCSTIGYTSHAHKGSDADGIAFLKASLTEDFQHSARFNLTVPFTRAEHNARSRLSESHHLYEEFFASSGANERPLFVSTSVKDGEIFVNAIVEDRDSSVNVVLEEFGFKGLMDDWLVKYSNGKGINLSQLVHDDYFLAIKITFNAGLYVSSMKLLVSCIDSLAYIEYGDEQGAFVSWLNMYADLRPIGITAVELWELRNGLLHMTNTNSKKVRRNNIRRISFRVGGPPDFPRDGAGEVFYFDFYGLLSAFSDAQRRWIDTYNSDSGKFFKFIERYDETISDTRVAISFPGSSSESP
jgi:hypothetical protein